jgi:farnesol dehydrogenase
MKVFLTGGTGFLGKRVAARLAAAGHTVRALVRPSSPRGRMPETVATTPGDVTDLGSLERGAEGCDAIVHSAALVKMWVRDRRDFDRINVEGLANILEAGRRAAVQRILYTSSFIALGPTDGRIADESWLHQPGGHHNDYERTKAAADLVARKAAEAGAPLVTVYPGVVYGAGELTDGSLMTRTILDFMKRKVPGYLGSGHQRICYAYIDDVVEGHLLALERARAGSRYILGGPNATYRELYALLASITGTPAPTRHLPFWLMALAGRLMRWRADFTGIEPMITDEVVEVYRHDWAYSSERAAADLGYRITPLEEGLRRTVEWLRSAAS